ncbi:MAG TPA: biopolymer transporter ExbD [Rhizomicrobium sp.]|nr:biopolymer transporter ExbD [Rhizomicrobium sp.]
MTGGTRSWFAGLFVAIALIVAACSPPPVQPAKPVIVVVHLTQNGTALWNGRAVDSATLDRLLDDAARQTPQPEIHLEADRRTDYSAVVKVLALIERKGVTHIGFTGIETMP